MIAKERALRGSAGAAGARRAPPVPEGTPTAVALHSATHAAVSQPSAPPGVSVSNPHSQHPAPSHWHHVSPRPDPPPRPLPAFLPPPPHRTGEVQPVTVAGESFTGPLGLVLGARHPKAADNLIIINSGSAFRRQPLLYYGSNLLTFLPEPLMPVSSFGLAPFLSVRGKKEFALPGEMRTTSPDSLERPRPSRKTTSRPHARPLFSPSFPFPLSRLKHSPGTASPTRTGRSSSLRSAPTSSRRTR